MLRSVKHVWLHCPVIMYTGTGSEEIAVEAIQWGLDDYVLMTVKHAVRVPVAVHSALEHGHTRRARREPERRLQASEGSTANR